MRSQKKLNLLMIKHLVQDITLQLIQQQYLINLVYPDINQIKVLHLVHKNKGIIKKKYIKDLKIQ